MSKKEARDKALSLLERVGIPNPVRTFKAYPLEVSGGMAQRVLIAGAVSTDPDLIIADEPTTALDVTVQAEVLDLLRDLQAERHMAMLLVTHNFGVVADLCDRVTVMQSGLFVETGPVRAIFQRPEHPYTKSLLASILDEGPARPPLALAAHRNSGRTRHERVAADRRRPRRRVPRQGVPRQAVPGAEGRLDRHQARRDRRSGRRVRLGQDHPRPRRARSRAGHRRDDHVRRQGHQPPAAARSAARCSSEIQVVFQDPYSSLNPSLTIEQILAEPLQARGVASATAQDAGARPARPGRAARRTPRSRLPREFSGGQRQRIAIARALALDPKLIVCDEPVSALDLSTQARVLDLFIEIQERTGVAYLFITHDLAVVRHISHRVAVMYRGEIVETGDGDQVTARPEHPYTQRLFMAAPVPDPDKQEVRRVERRALLDAESRRRVTRPPGGRLPRSRPPGSQPSLPAAAATSPAPSALRRILP